MGDVSYHQLLDRLCQIQLRDQWDLIAFDPRARNHKGSIFGLLDIALMALYLRF